MSRTPSHKDSAPRQVTQGAVASARILDAADELFYREGSRSVGVDAVVKQAGVNKMSLYRQFSSKDELLRLYLERRDARFFNYFETSIGKHPDNARAALLQIFVDLAARTAAPGYRGCPFVNVAVEYPDPAHFARQQIAGNKHRLLLRLTELATHAGAATPDALAKALALLIEGAYAASQTYSAADALLDALPDTARALIDRHLTPARAK